MVCSNCSVVRWWRRTVLEGRKNLSTVVLPSLPFLLSLPPSSFSLPLSFLPSLFSLPFSLFPLSFHLFFFPFPFPFLFIHFLPLFTDIHSALQVETGVQEAAPEMGHHDNHRSSFSPSQCCLSPRIRDLSWSYWLVSALVSTFYIEICAYFVNWSIFAKLKISLCCWTNYVMYALCSPNYENETCVITCYSNAWGWILFVLMNSHMHTFRWRL